MNERILNKKHSIICFGPALLFGLVSMACTMRSPELIPDERAEVQPVIVTRENPSLPSRCSPLEVARLILQFFDAFNRGDQEQLAKMFSLGGSDQDRWYSVSDGSLWSEDRTHFVAYTNEDLLAYFAERHEMQEHLNLLKVDVGPGHHRNDAGIAIVLSRQAKDLRTTGKPFQYLLGKGQIDCVSQTILVWSVGAASPDSEPPLPELCPPPPLDSPGNAVIACARNQ
jgi:hypothetical protein